jgi:hypothetical protein
MYAQQSGDLNNRYNAQRGSMMGSSAQLLQALAQQQSDQRARDAAVNGQLQGTHESQANTARDDYARLLHESQAGTQGAAPSWLQDQYAQGAGAANDALVRQQALAARLGQVNDQDYTTRVQGAQTFGNQADTALQLDLQQQQSQLQQEKLKQLMALMG